MHDVPILNLDLLVQVQLQVLLHVVLASTRTFNHVPVLDLILEVVNLLDVRADRRSSVLARWPTRCIGNPYYSCVPSIHACSKKDTAAYIETSW